MTVAAELPDLSNLKHKVRQYAREVDAHHADGNTAAYMLGECLFRVWNKFENDQNCPEKVLLDRVEQFVSDLDLDPEAHFIPHGREQLRAIVNRVAEGDECSLSFLCRTNLEELP